MRQLGVVFLGVGGVGKTTYIYRLLGTSKRPAVTTRPRWYPLYADRAVIYLVDVPGQRAVEVARGYYQAVRTYGARVDLIVYMYSVVEPATLDALSEIHQWAAGVPASARILVGNKRDLAEEAGFMVEGDGAAPYLGVLKIYYTSALKDDAASLFRIIAENLPL
ncbi:MAG: GTPase domain-containing protein [Pyrobaculum arsenaticum]|uniref:Miro domain protein n=1 Tax=Pyrobaculum arsenaticum (strain DSM 13514 / JCM 11321 / PZ6) TaxID=340102 RepID=A4WMG4_PYRAR|nr:GTPase domain-containing protein [Pyrobaculum arsenaticum]ABP51581.1 Miro domain protein [Pyrobaculum arsenaticum DSM 13514]MCY0891415.1 GTPase domain-containing protein [Pyrobaculum arsenaticum]